MPARIIPEQRLECIFDQFRCVGLGDVALGAIIHGRVAIFQSPVAPVVVEMGGRHGGGLKIFGCIGMVALQAVIPGPGYGQ